MIMENIEMTYEEYVLFLKKKYGSVPFNYFSTESFKTVQKKNKRTGEGLYIHHIDEDKEALLSNPKVAKNQPFEYQLADRLVYCNLLEHCLLHFMIFKEHKFGDSKGVGGLICFIIPELNDIYSGIKYSQPWKINVVQSVIDYKEEYLELLKKIWEYEKINIFTSLEQNEQIWSEEQNEFFFEEIIKKLKE